MPPLPQAPYPADLYLATHSGTPGDVSFYRRVCAEAESVLELGCGGGRVLAAIAEAGVNAVGLEHDADLVARAQARSAACDNVRIVSGDMRDFALGERFDRVIIPYNGIYCLLSNEEVARCLACVAKHLAIGGLLVFDGYAVDVFHDDSDPSDQSTEAWEPVATAEVSGVSYEVLERSCWDRETQRIDAFYKYRAPSREPQQEYRLTHRYLLSEQVGPLLHAANLQPVVLHGDFDQSVFTRDSPRLIVTAANASDRSI